MTGPAIIPDVDISRVMGRVHRLWNPDKAPHHLIAGESGAGKTTLITRVVLPLCAYERQLIVDVKGDDEVWLSYPAKVVDRLRPGFGSDREGGGPEGAWFRLVLDMTDKAEAKARAAEALDIVADEGYVTMVIDETRRMTDTQQLNQGSRLESILMSNRSRHTQAILTLTATEWTMPSVRNQWAFSWTGPLKDDEVRKRWLKILGLPAATYLPELRRIPRHRWLYRDEEHGGIMGMTGLPWDTGQHE